MGAMGFGILCEVQSSTVPVFVTRYVHSKAEASRRLAVHRPPCPTQHASLETARSSCSRSDQLELPHEVLQQKQEPHKSQIQHRDTRLLPSDL